MLTVYIANILNMLYDQSKMVVIRGQEEEEEIGELSAERFKIPTGQVGTSSRDLYTK